MICSSPLVSETNGSVPPSQKAELETDDNTPRLLSDEPTMELLVRARGGDRMATEALLERALPALRRWAHGRLPAIARSNLDTNDLVQDAALNLLRRIELFEPRHV